MKRFIAFASLVTVSTSACLAGTGSSHHAAAKPASHHHAAAKPASHHHAKLAARCRVAPADEYFGKLKLSILGIRNTIKDQGLILDVYPEKNQDAMNKIAFAEDAVHDWQHRYPCDSWLPGTVFALEHFYGRSHIPDAAKRVHATYAWFRHDFPRHRLLAEAAKEDGMIDSAAVATAPTVNAPAAVPAPALSPQP